MLFESREQAARLLAEKLIHYRGQNPLVLGIPRGAVPMAKIIADTLKGDVDVVLVHKLGAPGRPELAVGAVDESGCLYRSADVQRLGIDEDYIQAEKSRQLESLRQRRAKYTPLRLPIDPSGRTVIVVDNGIATGATMIAALSSVRAKRPKKLIAAAAVAPPETLERMRAQADEVFCLETPQFFSAVGQFFRDFHQVSDVDVAAILSQSAARPALAE